MILLVSGARAHPSRPFVEAELTRRWSPVAEVWQGAARGVDEWAGLWATARTMTVRDFPVGWDHLADPPNAVEIPDETPNERNQRMVDAALKALNTAGNGHFVCNVLAFPDGSKGGTWDLVRRARVAGFRVVVCEVPDPRQESLFG